MNYTPFNAIQPWYSFCTAYIATYRCTKIALSETADAHKRYYREHDSFNTNYSIRSRIANMLLVEKTLHRLRLLLTAT